MEKKLSAEATFLIEAKWLEIKGNPPDLEKIKTALEKEIGRPITLTITKQEGNHIKGNFTL